jgi:hypothetical protein
VFSATRSLTLVLIVEVGFTSLPWTLTIRRMINLIQFLR